MTTTAEYRKLAATCEQARDWSQAALYYDKAADAYPHTIGELAARDVDSLRRRAKSCRTMCVTEHNLCGFDR